MNSLIPSHQPDILEILKKMVMKIRGFKQPVMFIYLKSYVQQIDDMFGG